MVLTQNWLPIGSVVHVTGSEGLYFIIGYMQQTTDGAVWDYAARPYPMGYMGDDQDIYLTVTVLTVCMVLAFKTLMANSGKTTSRLLNRNTTS